MMPDTIQYNTESSILKAEGLSLGYGRGSGISGDAVLSDINLHVRRGERWFILGRNGEGKSTLMRGMLGLIHAPPDRLWRHPQLMTPQRLGYVPQRCELNPTLPTTVREFVTLGLIGVKTNRAECDERLNWALGRVGLAGFAGRDYWSLSGGQRQRALLGRALIRQPGVLLMDEPTSGLDLTGEDALMRLLSALNAEEGLTLIVILHNLEVAARWATHVALVFDGGVVAGPANQVLQSPHLRNAYRVPISVSREDDGVASVRIGDDGEASS